MGWTSLSLVGWTSLSLVGDGRACPLWGMDEPCGGWTSLSLVFVIPKGFPNPTLTGGGQVPYVYQP